MSKPVLFWLALLFLVAGGTFGWLAYRQSQGGRFGSVATVDTSYLAEPDLSNDLLKSYALTERGGRTFRSEELAGEVSVASFFYTACPTECLQQNAKMQELAREFKGQDVVFLSISCDPEVDNPARLREYARKFEADEKQWLFLTGNLLYLRRIGAEIYQVPVDTRTHTERFIVVGRDGKLAGHFNWKEAAQMTAVRKKIAAELAKPVPAAESAEETSPRAETPAKAAE